MGNEEGLHREVREWLRALGERVSSIETLPGDVSMRRYLRARFFDGSSAIVAVYPEPRDPALDRFLITGRLLTEGGVRVPGVRAHDPERALVLLEDLGPSTLYDLRERGYSRLQPSLERAAESLARIARLPAASIEGLNPPLDDKLLRRELEVGWRLFLTPHGLDRESGAGADLEAVLAEVCRRLDRAPWIPAHRDFMARNLIPLEDGEVAVLDHQDLRLGAGTYDIASLLNDSLYPEPALAQHLRSLVGETADAEPLYHAAVVQRTLKIIGTFERFARRGGVRYRRLIPPSLERFLGSLAEIDVCETPLLTEVRTRLTSPVAEPPGPAAGASL